MTQPPTRSTLFPYTTLFRSLVLNVGDARTDQHAGDAAEQPEEHRGQREPRGAPEHDGHIADRKSTRLNSSHTVISYAVFCLKKKNSDSHPDWHAMNIRKHST